MTKTVSAKMWNVRGNTDHVMTLALEPDETTIKISIGDRDVYVLVTDLIEAARLFEAALG